MVIVMRVPVVGRRKLRMVKEGVDSFTEQKVEAERKKQKNWGGVSEKTCSSPLVPSRKRKT